MCINSDRTHSRPFLSRGSRTARATRETLKRYKMKVTFIFRMTDLKCTSVVVEVRYITYNGLNR